ncbi:transporter substrate-binding domain-containing protein [Paracoccus aminophilus]|uniref:ABC-type branched-chain amino acid transport systems, periplasmic component n=1 Tax=Paracoccus aminophilus JCM 7686 TaxID=1367847 RepID=S5Y4Q0_PARAH|nr:transporter substrate-binding domain-containing protein [Paracoccus aminophilus]AGT10720.1 ABC-type branched-chain amino acid transport systems, periplasmic component [Paracoccus aminophilus JCM 7686]
MISILPLALLFSHSGPYEAVSRSSLNGARLACAEINADADFGLRIEPIEFDPAGRPEAYPELARAALARGITNICGCYTSSSRKEVLPEVERQDALLWFPVHYEGFENSPNVIYSGSGPNQHMTPLIDYLTAEIGNSVCCIGSNYVWGWESNRIMCDSIRARGGKVLSETYLDVGVTDVAQAVETILRLRPDFVFNALIGESSYAFIRALRQVCVARGIDQPRLLPVASCNLSEPELVLIGPEAADGHLSASVYFAAIPGAKNRAFVEAYRAAYPDGPCVSVEAEGAYNAVHLIARAARAAGASDAAAIRKVLGEVSFDAPQGRIALDPLTQHAWLTPRIGRSRADASFEILFESPTPVAPDPYLTRAGNRELPATSSFELGPVR